jgi:DNA-binding transcriptional regulator YhcF (GntR family)
MPKALEVDWPAIQNEYFLNLLSMRQLAEKYDVNYHTLYRRAKKWAQQPESARAEEVKRRLVSEQSSLGERVTSENRDQLLEQAVSQDVADMNLGLRNARKALNLAHDVMELLDAGDVNPVAIKSLVDSSKTSIEIIRKIRGLDAVAEDDLSGMSIDELKEEIERLSE